MKVSVIGNGRWGSFLAWYAARTGHDVTLYGRPGSPHTVQFEKTRKNELLTLPDDVTLTSDFAQALAGEVILVSIPSQNLRQLLAQVAEVPRQGRPLFVLCMKGLEIATGERLSQVAKEMLGENSRVAVWLGPGHVQEFVRGVPNCMVVDSEVEDEKRLLVQAFGSELIRFYYGEDLIGNEVGAAAKNVVGIAAGMLDGFGLTSLKGALMSRGTREYARLIKAMGGNELSAYGLCHLGDYEATVFSQHSNNRMFGESFIQKKPYEKLAEGYYTVQAIVGLSEKMGVELPISQALYQVLYQQEEPQKVLDGLFSRSLKQEFY